MMTIMEAPYAYQALQPSLGIRLLRLLPSKDAAAILQGQLFEYSLEDMYTEASSYDALSYAWGDVETSESISIDGLKLPITSNLQVALMHLRHQHVERLLWVDQLCIDQNNEKEKEDQIKLMSQIYACANCVIVWLGEEEDDSDYTMEELRTLGMRSFTNPRERYLWSDGDSRLFQRPWFRRIWVLQEVGVARRVQIRCGRSVIDGYAFALATEVLEPTSETCGEEQALHNRIQSAAFLIKQSIFRPPYHGPPTSLGGICTFGELVDMFHNREATKNHDKIYALLGLSSTDMVGSGLLPDYTVPFGQLFERLIKFVISNQLTVQCLEDKEVAVFKGRGCIIGTIIQVKDGILNEHEKRVVVRRGHDVSSNMEALEDIGNLWDLRIPAIPLREGDIIILLEGAAEPSIIRVYEDFLILIVAVATLRSANGYNRPKLIPMEDSVQIPVCKRDFVLIWDWNYSLESYSHLRRFAMWAKSKNWMPAGSNLIEANGLDDLTRLWDCAAIQSEGQAFQASITKFKVCIREFEGILPRRELHKEGEHLLVMIYSMIGESFTTLYSRSEQLVSFQEALTRWFITSLFHLAIRECHNNVIDLLIGTGHVDNNWSVRDDFGLKGFASRLVQQGVEIYPQQKPHPMTPLQAAAWDTMRNASPYSEGIRYGKTALQAAAEVGSLPVVERLLKMGADINAPAAWDGGKTALQAAAKTGNIATVDLLLRHNADINQRGANDYGRTALQAAAEAGQIAVVQFLVQHHADINAPSAISEGKTALQAAAGAGHLQIVEYLLEHKADVNAPATKTGITALGEAAEAGHLQIVECLLEHRADANVPTADSWGRTTLQAAAEAGYLQIVECLLEYKADVNAPAAFSSGRTAVQAAAETGQMAIIQRLVHYGADINAPASTDHGRTALQAAAGAGHLQIVEYLLEHKADVNAPAAELDGRTALQAAAEAGHLQIVECLLEHKADVNASKSTYVGITALKAAAEKGHLAIVERLKQAGALDR